MRKAAFLTLLLTLCGVATAWAEFNPTAGKPYALQERTSGLYLDILVGVDNPYDDGVQRNISLVSSPCEIYFEKFDWDAWAIKNVDGEYVCNEQAEGLTHNTKIGSTKKDWVFLEEDGYLIIETWGPFIYGEAKVGAPLFYGGNTENDKKTPMQFTLVEFANLTQDYTFYIDSNAPQGVSVTYAGNPVYDAQTFTGDFVVGSFDATDVEGYTWEIVVDDENRTITLVYTRVQEVPSQIDCPTVGTIQDDKYHFTSGSLQCPVPCNTLRFTLTESGAFFQNGSKRMSLDEFRLYNAEGEEVELEVSYITGNNNKSYAGMLDGVNNVYAGTKTWSDGTEDDWFEITLPNGVDLGGSFSFSFVTENTTMNAKAFRIDMSYVGIEVNGWQFEYRIEPGNPEVVILTGVLKNGDPDLVIPETIEIFGEQCKVVGFDHNIFANNKDLQTISLPSTFEFLGENALFAQSFTGDGNTQTFNVDIKNNEAWTITMDVVRTDNLTGWGSCLIASGSDPAKPDESNYAEGFQLYLQCTEKGATRDKLIIKTKTQVKDDWFFDDVYQEKKFTVVVEYNGAQQLSVNVLKADGTNATNHEGNQEPIVFTDCTIEDITQLCTNIQAAITANFVIDKGYPFEGCTNLTSITVADGNPNYRSIGGILYSKDAQTLVRIPEGKTKATISPTVTTVGYGAAVNIDGPITFASNPKFMLGAVDFATSLHLALDDANGIDFNTTNANTYAQVSYTRQLPDDVYGSIILPFTPLADVLDNYEFYEFRSAVGDELTFSFVEFPVANTPYIYREATASRPAMQADTTTIKNPASLITSNDTWQTVGTYTTHSVACDGAHYYGISANDNHKMYHVTGTIKAKPFRAYFKNTDTSSAAIPSFTIRLRGKDETTVIDSTLIDREYNGDVYDLTGRRVANPTKGIYIVNGKKVVVK